MIRKEVIGDATLYCGDCLEVLPTLGKVDAVVTDPPYGIGIAANPVRQKHARMTWDNAAPNPTLFDAIRAMSTTQIIWGGNYFDLPPTQCFLIWDKVQPEKFSLAMCEQAWTNLKKPAKLFRRHVVSYDKQHPTQKPLELMQWCMGFIPDAGVVLDPFAGSGTTGAACFKVGKSFIGIEREPKYFDVMCRRIEAVQREPDLFIKATPETVAAGLFDGNADNFDPASDTRRNYDEAIRELRIRGLKEGKYEPINETEKAIVEGR